MRVAGRAAVRSPEPAVVSQPPGRSRWDPLEARASRGFSEAAPARPSWGFCGLRATTFCGGNRGPPAFASHTLRSAAWNSRGRERGRRRPPASAPPRAGSQRRRRAAWARQRARRRRRRSGAERGLTRRGRRPRPRLPLRTAQSCSRAMFLSVGAPRAPEAAARRSRPGAVAPLGPHRRTPPPACSGRSASARRAGSPTAAASRRAEDSWRRPLPRRAPLKWRAPGAPAHLSSERSAACRPRGHCARAAPPARVPRPPPRLPVLARGRPLPAAGSSLEASPC